MAPQLLATAGPLAGQTLTLQPGENSVGREAGNQIIIDDQAVSRRHARIMVINGVATIEDLGSTTGTWVNEQRIAGPTLLKVGDSLRLGGSVFSFIPLSVAPPDLGQRKPREKSRYQESAPMPMAPLPSSGNAGCMPDFSQIGRDISGCLGPFMKYLVIILVILLLLCLIGICVSGIGLLGMAGGAAAAGGGAAAAGGAPSGAGAGGNAPPPQNTQPQSNPPQNSQQPPNQNPPPQQPPQNTQGIEIIKIEVKYVTRPSETRPVPVVFVTWRNKTQQPISELICDIKGLDSAKRELGTMKETTIFKGDPVLPEEVHEDKEPDGTTFELQPEPGKPPPVVSKAELDKFMIR